jgi:hypothetical protein
MPLKLLTLVDSLVLRTILIIGNNLKLQMRITMMRTTMMILKVYQKVRLDYPFNYQ